MKKKAKWRKAKLTVLVRGRQEEAVCQVCKYYGGTLGPAGSPHGCFHSTPVCDVISAS